MSSDTINHVSFVATSREEAKRAQPVKVQPVGMDKIFFASDALQRAFQEPQEADSDRPVRDRAPQGPQPTIIQRSGLSQREEADDLRTLPSRWGLVSTVVEAYNMHHELILRPDDIWQAILTQFSFYVNAHAEELRNHFVDFKGKMQLVVTMGGSLFTADYEEFAKRMVDENITQRIKDPRLVEWLVPGFTTTTVSDRVVASVTLMSTLQAYFEYHCCLMCGIPKVTLHGKVEDWQLLRSKIDQLPEYDLADKHMSRWHELLTPVLDEFVRAAAGDAKLDFWDRVCHKEGGGSGPSYLCGWITTFAVFTAKGKWQGPDVGVRRWPKIDTSYLPVGAVSVPVIVDDNGTQYDTQMIAGQVASEVVGKARTALQPRTDWCIAYTGAPRAQRKEYEDGKVLDEPEAA